MNAYRRPLMGLFLAFVAIALAGCNASLPKTEAAATPPLMPAQAAPKSLVEMQHEADLKAMELENARVTALIRFADESKSDFAKGLVSGMLGGGQPGAGLKAPQRSSFADLALRQQQHAAEVEIRRAELAERSSWWNRGLQLFDRMVPVVDLTQNYRLRKRQMDINADQYKYTLDAFGSTQRDAYDFGTTVLEQGTYFFTAPLGSTATRLD